MAPRVLVMVTFWATRPSACALVATSFIVLLLVCVLPSEDTERTHGAGTSETALVRAHREPSRGSVDMVRPLPAIRPARTFVADDSRTLASPDRTIGKRDTRGSEVLIVHGSSPWL